VIGRQPRRGFRSATRTAAAVALAGGVACSDPPEPSPRDVYSIVLAEARSRLHLEEPVQIHPLLAMIELDDGPAEISLLHFNDFDTAAVPDVIAAEPDAYRLCSPGAAGACRVPDGQTAIILSDILDLHDDGLAVVLVLTDRRPHADALQYWGVRLKPGFRRWDVVEFRRLGRQPRQRSRR